MYTEKDLGKLGLTTSADSEEENQEKSVEWLLDMDLTEPEEELFKVSGDDYQDAGLSAFEAEVAARPLIRGNTNGDDLANYVDEEIVISSDNSMGDIYARDSSAGDAGDTVRDESMAIDYSVGQYQSEGLLADGVDEGADILGLTAEDDIGEKYVSIKRVKRTKPAAKGKAGATVVETILLSDAPETTQVVEPGNDDVANDSEAGNVQDYVASMPDLKDLEDDEAFDKYLLAGEHLDDGDADPEELVFDASEQVEEDSSSSTAIDYHDDFLTLDGFSDSGSAIAPVIGQVMEEVSTVVRARLQSLGVDGDAVTVEVKIAADEASLQQCNAEAFLPLHDIYSELPECLESLEPEARASIYLRLQHTASNEAWNDLFSGDFARHLTPQEDPELGVADEVQEAAEKESSHDEGFGEDIFGDDFNDEFTAQLDSSANAEPLDIEEAFSDLDDLGEVTEELVADSVTEPVKESVEEAAEESTQKHVEPEVVAVEQPPVEDLVFAEAGGDDQVAEAVEEPVVEEIAAAATEEPVAAATENAYPGNFIPDYIDFNFTSQSNAEIFADFLDAFIEEGSVEVEKLEHEVSEWEKDIASDTAFSNVSRTLHTIKGIAKGVGLHRLGTLVHNFETLLDKMPRPLDSNTQGYFRVVNAWLDAVVRGFEYVSENRADIASELPVHQVKVEAEAPKKASEADTAKSGKSTGTRKKGKSATEKAADIKSETAKADTDTAGVVAPTQEDTAQTAEVEQSVPPVAAVKPKPDAVSIALAKKRDKQLADEGAKVLAAQQSVRMTSEKLDHLLNLTSQVQQLGVRASQNTSRSKRSSAELHARLSSVRTHIRKIADRALLNVNAQPGKSTPDLDALEMDQYSELQEAANILREGVEDLTDLVDVLSRQNSLVETLLKQQSSVISSISSSIQGARVVPVSRLMPGLRRIVRTVSTDLGKVVSFQVMNETGALDRDHYARLQVILEHMVRNALDHGVEMPEERAAVGKPTGGRISVDVRQSGGDYVITLTDDGRGIDPDAIRQSAYEKDLDVDVDSLSDEEVIRLIFHKGFSTASTLSEISGRGVGMDIVVTELQQLGGDVQIQSTVGEGTSFEVRIPSNVSVNGALLVAAGGESYAVPLNGLIGVEQVPVEEFFEAVEQNSTLTLSGMECGATYLGTLCQGMPLPDRSVWSSFVPVIVAGSDDSRMAIAIDNVEEALELVVRSLGAQFSTVPGVAGAATTAEGEAIVALDLNMLVMSAGEEGIAPVSVSQSQAAAPLALVVDDSRTQRMVATSQLDSVGVETITAENGLVAIDLLNAAHRLPDVILLDVEMPVKDGIETLREIRNSSRYGELPVIMVTSRTGAKHRALASEAGCSAYMGKPFNFAALLKQINELTGLELQAS